MNIVYEVPNFINRYRENMLRFFQPLMCAIRRELNVIGPDYLASTQESRRRQTAAMCIQVHRRVMRPQQTSVRQLIRHRSLLGKVVFMWCVKGMIQPGGAHPSSYWMTTAKIH
ncbi:hypothetical protein CHS0354_019096 [Potamilus streckersoni]|uniref:Uncharacterized protein n=1 Tax=Potamilus streckersoni TaxID=2493646 RepID=A0AAE0SUB1_9BIVA|nr:hypothetical protein CHS0354_019096 [Potamilus streckersoni]